MVDSLASRRTFNLKAIASSLFALLFLASIAWLLVWVGMKLLGIFSGMNSTLAVSLITASTTIIVSTFTIMAGRYFERKKEREALYRDKKTAIYEEFLVVLFQTFLEAKEGENTNQETGTDMVKFLREHHRKLILWTGPKGLKAYSDWHKLLQTGLPTAQTVLKMERFFLALRTDLGHSNKGLKEGDILRLILNDTDLLLRAAKANPNVTLAEISALKDMLAERTQPSQ